MNAISILDRIQVSHDHAFFASASNDGTVKLWESEKLEGNSVANRSKQTLKNTSLPGKILQKLCLLFLYLPEITNICTHSDIVGNPQPVSHMLKHKETCRGFLTLLHRFHIVLLIP